MFSPLAASSRVTRIVNMKTDKELSKETRTDKWSYVVCFGTIITFIAGIGHVNSFGLIYKDFIVDTDSSAKSLTTAHGVFSIMLAMGGLILNILTTRCSLRLGGLIGALILSSGSFLTVFISNTNQLPITFGVMQGIGFGMMVPVCYSTFNHYFVRKRTQAMSLVKATQGVILIWYPQFLKTILSNYGFRSTLLLISGIALHTFPGMAAMNMTVKKRTAKVSVENGTNQLENLDLLDKQNYDNRSQANKTINKNMTLTVFGYDILEWLNVSVLNDPVFCNICIGQSFVNFSDVIFFVLQPMLLYQYGLNTNEVAACISISTGADVAGRFGLAFISNMITVNTRLLFYVATFFTLTARIVILQVRQFIWLAIITSLLGVLRAWLHVASPLVISHYVANQDFTGAYALFMLSTGLVNVILSPLIGLLKDLYQDYIPAFYALTACCLPCLFLWPMEYFFKNKSLNN